jgi:general secretion pathway protein E
VTFRRSELKDAALGPLASKLSLRYLEEYCVLPLGVDPEGTVATAVGRTLDPSVSDELSRIFGRRLRLVQTPPSEVLAAIMSARHERESAGDEADVAPRISPDAATEDPEALANQAPVVKLVNVLILDAVRMGASDIHIESLRDGTRVRYRVDGVLQDGSTLSDRYSAAVMSRLKIIAGLDITEKRLAQDGRARLRLEDRDVDLRASTLPTLHGESIALRILDHAGHGRNLSELGMPEHLRESFDRLIRGASGIVLVTGPTGSGKTTTLYAAIGRVNSDGVKIVTIEDPVEYEIPGIVQVPVNPRAGLNFSTALRSILRHDPNIIMVGEMRDAPTAEIAVQAALTGHLVFSTLHTSDAAGAVNRLLDMGVPAYQVAATLGGVLAQRLVRVLCESCREQYTPDPAEIPAGFAAGTGPSWRAGKGCGSCSGTSYRGRIGIYEFLPVSDEIRQKIAHGASVGDLRGAARAAGMTSLIEEGWDLVRRGVTSITELNRVLGEQATG